MTDNRRIWGAWPTYIGFLAGGGLLLVIAYLLVPGQDTLSRASTALAIGLIVGGVTGLIHTLYLEREIRAATYDYEMEQLGRLMRSFGLRNIFPRRPLSEMRAAIGTARESIRLVGSSVKGLMGMEAPSREQEAILQLLADKVSNGIETRLLLAHPLVAGYREKMEIREKGSIPTEIIENLHRLITRFQMARDQKSWQIRLYKCGPTVFCLEIDSSTLFLEPYPLGGTSMDNLCVFAEIPSGTANVLKLFMASHFDNAWERADCRIRSVSELRSLVDDLAKEGCITDEQKARLMSLPGMHDA